MPTPCVVLVTDDNPGDSLMMREALDFVGFNGAVVAVENAPRAFDYLTRHPPFANVPLPHVIMLDLNMPIVSGFEILRELKRRPEWAAIDVMIFTSSRQPADMAKAESLGAKRFITKPVDWTGYTEIARDVRVSCCAAA